MYLSALVQALSDDQAGGFRPLTGNFLFVHCIISIEDKAVTIIGFPSPNGEFFICTDIVRYNHYHQNILFPSPNGEFFICTSEKKIIEEAKKQFPSPNGEFFICTP